MTLDLNEARRLHDRDPDDPGHCLTCRDDTGACVPWPCPTAIALGATGRSEWATPAQCDTARPDEADRQYITACILPTGHPGLHQDPDEGKWADTDSAPCTCGHARGTHKQDAMCRNCDCDNYDEAQP